MFSNNSCVMAVRNMATWTSQWRNKCKRGKLTTKLFHKNGTKLMTSEIKEVCWFIFVINIHNWNFVRYWCIQQYSKIDLLGVVKSTQGMCYLSINVIQVQMNNYRRWIITQGIKVEFLLNQWTNQNKVISSGKKKLRI